MGIQSSSRFSLTRWPVTALAEEQRRSDYRLGLPGPHRPQLAGDSNDRHPTTNRRAQ